MKMANDQFMEKNMTKYKTLMIQYARGFSRGKINHKILFARVMVRARKPIRSHHFNYECSIKRKVIPYLFK